MYWIARVVFFFFCFGGLMFGKEMKVVVMDFGGVVGKTDMEAVEKALVPLLNISSEESQELLRDVKDAKEKKKPRTEVWKEYEKNSGKILPDTFEENFDTLKLLAIRPDQRMVELVHRLKAKGYAVAMLSNVTEERAAYIRKMGVYGHFDRVFLSCEMGVKKPEKKAYQNLLDELKVSPQECLFIDNREDNIQSAKSLGFETVYFTSFEELDQFLQKNGFFS